MAVLQYSRRAESDLKDISSYTLNAWGAEQAARYLSDLRSCCERLAVAPLLGRPCEAPHAQLRRLEHRKHVIFYLPQERGILIVRVLHQRMLFKRHRLTQ